MRKASWLILASIGLTVGCPADGTVSQPNTASVTAAGSAANAVPDASAGAMASPGLPSGATAEPVGAGPVASSTEGAIADRGDPVAAPVVHVIEMPLPADLQAEGTAWPVASVKMRIPREDAGKRSIQYISTGVREVVGFVDGREYRRQAVPADASEIEIRLKIAPGKHQIKFDLFGDAQRARRLASASREALIEVGKANAFSMKCQGIVDRLALSWGEEEPPVLVTGTPATFSIKIQAFDAASYPIDRDPFLTGITVKSDAPADAIQLATEFFGAPGEDGFIEVPIRYTGAALSAFSLSAKSVGDGGDVSERLSGPSSLGRVTASVQYFDFLELGATASVRVSQQGFTGDFEPVVDPEGIVTVEDGPERGTFVIEAAAAGTGRVSFIGAGDQRVVIPVSVTTVEFLLD